MASTQETEDLGQPEYMKTVVIKPHDATDHLQIDLKLNDIVYVLEQDETGWWGGFKEGEERTGWFPSSCVKQVPFTSSQNDLASQEIGSCTGQVGSVISDNVGEQRDMQGAIKGSPMKQSPATQGPDRRGNRSIASPMRATSSVARVESKMHDESGSAWVESAPQSTTKGEAAMVEAIGIENASLKKEKKVLEDHVVDLNRKIEADRQSLIRLEAVAEEERKRREQLEQEIQVRKQEQGKLLAQEHEQREQLEWQLQAQREVYNKLVAEAAALREQLQSLAAKKTPAPVPQPEGNHGGSQMETQLQFKEVGETRALKDSHFVAKEIDEPVGVPVQCLRQRSLPSSARSALQDLRPLPRAPQLTSSTPLFTAASVEEVVRSATTATERPLAEEPARGTVAEKVTLFSALMQKPKMRSSSCNAPRESRENRGCRAVERSLGQAWLAPGDLSGPVALRSAPRVPPRLPS